MKSYSWEKGKKKKTRKKEKYLTGETMIWLQSGHVMIQEEGRSFKPTTTSTVPLRKKQIDSDVTQRLWTLTKGCECDRPFCLDLQTDSLTNKGKKINKETNQIMQCKEAKILVSFSKL